MRDAKSKMCMSPYHTCTFWWLHEHSHPCDSTDQAFAMTKCTPRAGRTGEPDLSKQEHCRAEHAQVSTRRGRMGAWKEPAARAVMGTGETWGCAGVSE